MDGIDGFQGGLVVISPHCDDAVFACGCLLEAHPGSTVVTVFAGSPPAGHAITEWDRAAGFEAADDVIGIRRAEDASALALLDARPVWLNFCDSQYGQTPSRGAISTALSDVLDRVPGENLLVPLGLFHSDHLLAHEAALALIDRYPARRWFLYEDALYRRIPGLVEERIQACEAWGVLLEPVIGHSQLASTRKEAAVHCYCSQLRALSTAGRPGYADAFAPERYWRVRKIRHRVSAARSGVPMTVVIPTFNRVEEVTATVSRLSSRPERPRVIVVDNGSIDGTATRLQSRFPEITVIRLDENQGAAARNVGIKAAATEYVALCDDDAWWAPGALARRAALLDRHPRLAVITARVLVLPGGVEDPTCRRMALSPLPRDPGLPGAPILGFLAGASIVRRSAVLSVGGFEPRFLIGGEEALLALDLAVAGWAMVYVDDLEVYHRPSPSRDVGARSRLLCRNALWLSWLRRPFHVALLHTFRALRAAAKDRWTAFGIAQAFTGLPWVLTHRQVLPPRLEACVAELERLDTKAQRP